MALVHEFRRTGQTTRTLPDSALAYDIRRLSGFQNNAEIAGGPLGCSGTISRNEYNARTALYALGSTWLVKDTVSNEYIWGGELRDPVIKSDVVELVADGWGKISDRDSDYFLVTSFNLENWVPGDTDPLTYQGTDRIGAEIKKRRIVYRIKDHTPFRRNQAGNPTKWQNGLYRWVPGVDIRWIAFDIGKSKNDAEYSLELVTATGPFGALSVLDSWTMGPAGPSSVDRAIPAGSDLVGLRLIRTSETKHARRRMFTVRNLRIGALSQDDTYTLNQMFVELFTRMGASTTGVAASSVNTAPFEAEGGTYGQIADEVALLDDWQWRIYPDPATGAKAGTAGPEKGTVWELHRTNSPVELTPDPRYNKVRVPYKDQGGIIRHKIVNASTDPFGGGIRRIYNMEWEEPAHEALATTFAQKVADYLATEKKSGQATFTFVKPLGGGADQPGTKVKTGDGIKLINYGNLIVSVTNVSYSDDGATTTVELTTGLPLLEKWLARRQRLINRGRSPDAATAGILDIDNPTAPGLTVGFTKTAMKEGHVDYDMVVDVTHNGEDIDGNGTYISTIVVKYRPTDAGSTPITKANGGGWREIRKRNTEDGENDINEDPFRLVIEKIHHPHLWRWEVKAYVIDVLHQRSAYTSADTTKKPAAFGPPDPTGVTLDIDNQKAHITVTQPADPADASTPDPAIAFSEFELATDAGFTNIIRRDRRHTGLTKTFRLTKPGGATFHARVRNSDAYKNKSAYATDSGSKNTLSTPAAPSGVFQKINKRWRAIITATTITDSEEDIKRYPLQLVHKASHVAPTGSDDRHSGSVEGDATGADLTEVFRGIPANHWVYVRERAVTENNRSGWSGWSDLGQPATSEDTEGHAAGEITHVGHPTNVDTPVGSLPLDGANYNATYATASYPGLFAVWGYLHGGSGANFGVPDYRRRSAKGVGTSQSVGQDDGVAETERRDGHGDHPDHRHRHHHPNHRHNHGHGHNHAGHNHGHNHAGHGHGHTHGGHGHGHDHGQTHNHAVSQFYTGSQNTSGPGAVVGRTGTTSDAAGPNHTHSFAFSNGTKTGPSGSESGTGIANDSTSQTPTTDGTSTTPSTDSTSTTPSTDSTAADTTETTNDINTVGPTDAAGTAVVIDEDPSLPATEKGHKKHGHKRTHFIVWY